MPTLVLHIVDSSYTPVSGANLRGTDSAGRSVTWRPASGDGLLMATHSKKDGGVWVASAPLGRTTVAASADGYGSEVHFVDIRDEHCEVVLGLRRPGELCYTLGNNRLAFAPQDDARVLLLRGHGVPRALSGGTRRHKVELRPASDRSPVSESDGFVLVRGESSEVQGLLGSLAKAKVEVTVLRAVVHGDRPVLGLSNELVVRFRDGVERKSVDTFAARLGMRVTRPLLHAGNAYLFLLPGEPSYDVLERADQLRRDPAVLYVEPNVSFACEADAYTPSDTLWAQLTHLQLINADDAWDRLDDVSVNLRGGSPAVCIGVVDLAGVTPDHPDLTANLTDGTGKMVANINFAVNPIVAQTVAGLGASSTDHGTSCAGSATAAFDDSRGITGVAPNCHLIGARIGGAANTVLMADLYLWMAGFSNGSTTAGFPALPSQPADVISSSWGSSGLALSNTIRDCFDFLTTYGRGGRGTVLCWSLGNSGYIDFTAPAGGSFRCWPTYAKCIGVGASIDTSPTNPVPASAHADPSGATLNLATAVDTRALYSPYGATALRKPDLVAPAHTAYDTAGTIIDPVMGAVRVGTGSTNGASSGSPANDYTAWFGGTSHATPTVAGAVALILSANPALSWVQVRDVLRASSVRIDAGQANAVGQWQDLDGDGTIDYSRWYGAGRLDVDAAVALALDPTRALADVYVRENLGDTGAVPSGGSWWASPDIWVRKDSTTPIPTLAWGDEPPHENAVRGQDNAIFARVRNRGAAAADSVWVRAMLAHWPGLEFVYPDDFQPSTTVGGAIPSPLVPGTYLIGEQLVTNLLPNTDQVVKFTWPEALVPPSEVTVLGVPVTWHPCLLLEAAPHDGPAPVAGPSAPVQGDNNIAQRNIHIDDASDSDSDGFIAVVAGTRRKSGVATLVLDTTALRGAVTLRLRFADDAVHRVFVRRLMESVLELDRAAGPSESDAKACGVTLLDRTRVRLGCGPCAVTVEAAPGSRILCDEAAPARPQARLHEHRGLQVAEISGLRGRIEVPLPGVLPGNRYALLLVSVSGAARGDVWVSQRSGDGVVAAGYGIRRI